MPVQFVPEPTEYYWGLSEPDELCRHLISKRNAFYEFVNISHLFTRIIRIWNYYHGLYYETGNTNMEIQLGGDDLEQNLLYVNHLRALVHLLVTYTTQNRPAFECMAVNSDHKALEQARISKGLLEDAMHRKHLEESWRRMVEHALVLTAGYTECRWNPHAGKRIGANVETSQIQYEGDVDYANPTIFDVVYDFTAKDWRSLEWVYYRRPMNKWNLVARFPEKKTEILEAASLEVDAEVSRVNRVYIRSSGGKDTVDVWCYYHRPTDAVPNGRYVWHVGEKTWFEDLDWKEDCLPLHRLTPAEFLLTCFGWTPAFDLAGPQEAVNTEFSTIITNHNNYGQQKIWMETNDTISLSDLDAGCTVVQSMKKPEVLPLLATPPEVFKAIDVFVQHMEYVSGVNSVARGQPEASLKSGAALALVDSKAAQFASTFIAAAHEVLGDIGTATIKLYQKNVQSPRTVALIGKRNRTKIKEFAGTDLDMIDYVRVKTGNPLLSTTSGRYQIGQDLLAQGLIQTPQQLITILDTGQLEPLTMAAESQLQIIEEENDTLMSGGQVEAPHITDNHVLHILEHSAVMNSVEIRSSPEAAFIMTHVIQHVQMMSDPISAELQVILGYPNPLAPPPGVAGTPSGPLPPTGGAQGAPIPPPPSLKSKSAKLPGVPGPPKAAMPPESADQISSGAALAGVGR